MASSEHRNGNTDETDENGFMDSMTWVKASNKDCDCEECDAGLCDKPLAPVVSDISKALSRQSEYLSSTTRQQERKFIARGDCAFGGAEFSVSVYKFVIPIRATPLLEYSSDSYRLIYVEQLGNDTVIQRVGDGVIGSQEEIAARKKMDWKSQKAYVIAPQDSNVSAPIGWISERNDRAKGSGLDEGHSIIIVFKVAGDIKHLNNFCIENRGEQGGWEPKVVRTLCKNFNNYNPTLNSSIANEDGIFLKTIFSTLSEQ